MTKKFWTAQALTDFALSYILPRHVTWKYKHRSERWKITACAYGALQSMLESSNYGHFFAGQPQSLSQSGSSVPLTFHSVTSPRLLVYNLLIAGTETLSAWGILKTLESACFASIVVSNMPSKTFSIYVLLARTFHRPVQPTYKAIWQYPISLCNILFAPEALHWRELGPLTKAIVLTL